MSDKIIDLELNSDVTLSVLGYYDFISEDFEIYEIDQTKGTLFELLLWIDTEYQAKKLNKGIGMTNKKFRITDINQMCLDKIVR